MMMMMMKMALLDEEKKDFKDELELEDPLNDESFPTVPPPPNSPSPNTALKAIRVQIEEVAALKNPVKGFTFVYDDGVEITVGETQGRLKATILLEEDEHIVAVQPWYTVPYSYLEQLRFKTTILCRTNSSCYPAFHNIDRS
jgi:hypothetical protein